MSVRIRLFSTLALGAALAACGSNAAPVDDDLARDLEQIGGSSLELAPAASGTQIVSDIERTPKAPAAAPAPAPRRAKVAQPAPQPRRPQVRVAAPAPRQTKQAPAPAQEVAVTTPQPTPEPAAAAPRPTNPPLGAGDPPPGGWRSVNEVIRNSRIPIKP